MDDDLPQSTIAEQQRDVERRNFTVLTIQNLVLRVGWIFKTESVIMPAFLDVISGSHWVRGFLPILARFGQSIPPLLTADRLRTSSIKKYSLVLTSFGMAVPFLLLSFIWANLENKQQIEVKQQVWLTVGFLILYTLFFSATGMNQLAFGTLQGKLIRANRRGRLMGISGICGSIAAVIAAVLYLKPWLALPNHAGYTYVFLFNGAAFFVAGVVSCFCLEFPDKVQEQAPMKFLKPFIDAWRIYSDDASFRKAANVAMLFICSLLIFPHYQAMGREKLGTDNSDLINWVIVQNISAGISGLLLGMIADRLGNRFAIRIAVFTASTTPLLVIFLASDMIPNARDWYWITFMLLGLTPVIMKTILNYTLELVQPQQHSLYLSTMSVCFAIPFVLSIPVGILIELFPFQYVFAAVSGLVITGGVLTFWMVEPRFQD